MQDLEKDFDKQQFVGAVLIDLLKAFDLPYDLILVKLGACGYACDFLSSLLSNRKQMVKGGQFQSSWLNIIEGIPQCSIL